MAQLQCIVVTPEKTVRDAAADFVALPLFDGEIGIAPEHAPMIGRLGYGELRINQNSSRSRYYVEGGFVEVLDNVVTVLTNRAIPAESLDGAVIAEQLQAVQGRRTKSPEEMAQRDRQVEQLRGQLRVARRSV